MPEPQDGVIIVRFVGIKPPVWRLIQVPLELKLDKLHLVLVTCFVWEGTLEYSFAPGKVRQIFSGNFISQDDEKLLTVADLFSVSGLEATYMYNVDDEWFVELKLHAFAEAYERPRVLGGERSSPPENCGGVKGYNKICRVLDRPDRNTPESLAIKAFYQWYDPEYFDPDYVNALLQKAFSTRTGRGKRKSPKSSKNSCRSLLVIDNAALWQEAESELGVIREQIDCLENELDAHESVDLPAFRQRIAQECADLYRERHDLETQIYAAEGTLKAVQGLLRNGVRDEAEAYYWFCAIRDQNGPIPPAILRAWNKGFFAEGSETQFFDRDFDDLRQRFQENGAAFEERQEKNEVRRDMERRCTVLYRQIARQLHPDAVGTATEHQLQLWHDAQSAYEDKNVARLEAVLARSGCVMSKRSSFGEFKSLISDTMAQLHSLSISLETAKMMPSWGFASARSSRIKSLVRKARKEFEQENKELAGYQATLENELARLQSAARVWLMRRKKKESDTKTLL